MLNSQKFQTKSLASAGNAVVVEVAPLAMVQVLCNLLEVRVAVVHVREVDSARCAVRFLIIFLLVSSYGPTSKAF